MHLWQTSLKVVVTISTFEMLIARMLIMRHAGKIKFGFTKQTMQHRDYCETKSKVIDLLTRPKGPVIINAGQGAGGC